MKSDFPVVLTAQEVAEILRVSEDTVKGELEQGQMAGFKVGSEWRILKDELFRFMEIKMKAEDKTCVEENMLDVEWREASPFSHTWPEGSIENYSEAYEADLDLSDCSMVKIGYTTREAAGEKDRYRVIVFLKFGSLLIPAVEFAGANDFDKSHKVASVVKNDDNKQSFPGHNFPPNGMAR